MQALALANLHAAAAFLVCQKQHRLSAAAAYFCPTFETSVGD